MGRLVAALFTPSNTPNSQSSGLVDVATVVVGVEGSCRDQSRPEVLDMKSSARSSKTPAASVSNCTRPLHPWTASSSGKEALGRIWLERVWLYRLPNHAAINLRAITLFSTQRTRAPPAIVQTSLPAALPDGSSGTQIIESPPANKAPHGMGVAVDLHF
jgi:hypothetical protein